MKKILFIALFFIGCNQKNWYPETDNKTSMIVYTMQTHIPLDDFYRKVTGYDSIQVIIRESKLEANFCYPNKWEHGKWRKDTVYVHDTIYKPKVTKINRVQNVYIGGN
jgi:hypothetical protein